CSDDISIFLLYFFFFFFFFFSSRRRHTRLQGDWSSDVCSSDLAAVLSRLSSGSYWMSVPLHDPPSFGYSGKIHGRRGPPIDLHSPCSQVRLVGSCGNVEPTAGEVDEEGRRPESLAFPPFPTGA